MSDKIIRVVEGEVVRREPQTLITPNMNPATVFLSRFTSAQSRRVMTSSLCILGSLLLNQKVTDPRTVEWHKLRYPHVQRLRAMLVEESKYAPATANRHLSALRGVIEECWQLGLMTREESAQIQAVKVVRGNARDTGRALDLEELTKLINACDQQTVLGRRDAAVLVLAALCGMRRSEVCGVDVEHWSEKDGSIAVLGKGNKWRTVYPPRLGRELLKSWLERRGTAPGPLVLPAAKFGDAVVHWRMTDNGVYRLLQGIAKRAQVADFTPHDLRRTFITRLLDKGGDALTVSKLAGHNNVQTTLRYDKRGEAAKKAVSALLDD